MHYNIRNELAHEILVLIVIGRGVEKSKFYACPGTSKWP